MEFQFLMPKFPYTSLIYADKQTGLFSLIKQPAPMTNSLELEAE